MNRAIATTVLSLAFVLPTMAGKAADRRRAEIYKSMIEESLQLDKQLFGSKSLSRVQRLMRRADEYQLPFLTAIVCRYYREMEEDPIKALKTAAPILLGNDEWIENLEEKEKERRASYMEQKRRAFANREEAPIEETGLALAFPPPSKAEINERNGELAMECARCLLVLNQDQMALKYVDALGRDFPTEGRVRAWECLGDIRKKLKSWSQSIEAYRSSLELLKSLKSEGDGYTDMQAILKNRIERKLKEVMQLRDVEMYGPGYVMWRRADELIRKDELILEAYELYERIEKELPETVYAIGARCRRIQCLLEMAKKKGPGEGEAKTLKRIAKLVADENAFYKLARRERVPEQTLTSIRRDLEAMKGRLTYFESTEYGDKALESAKEIARAAIKENMWNLWNGEILVSIADFEFEHELDPEEADKDYRQAWAFLQAVESHDAAVAGARFSPPARASAAVAPNAQIVKVDKFGNICREEPPIGAVLNRRTAPQWYLNELRAKTVKAIGFICFHEGNNEEAKKWYEKINLYDSKSRLESQVGRFSDLYRLMWGAEHGFLFTEPEELEAFSKRRRFAIMLGDYYYCTERNSQALSIIGALKSSEFGKLSRNELASVYALEGSVVYRVRRREESFRIFERGLKLRPKGLVREKLLKLAFNTSCFAGKEAERRAVEYVKELARSRSKSSWASLGRISYGMVLLEGGRIEEGKKMLMSFDDPGYREMGEIYFNDFMKKQEEGYDFMRDLEEDIRDSK